MSIYFTSDPHFFHANIIKYCKRPWNTVAEMNQGLIDNFNSQVNDNDEIYCLGDFAFATDSEVASIMQKLKGIWHLVAGNHDNVQVLRKYFRWVKDYHELRVEDPDVAPHKRSIVLLHYPMVVWNKSHRGSWQLYGHVHGNLPDDPKKLSMDVGVDPNNYRLLSYEDVKAHMAKKEWKEPDYVKKRKDYVSNSNG